MGEQDIVRRRIKEGECTGHCTSGIDVVTLIDQGVLDQFAKVLVVFSQQNTMISLIRRMRCGVCSFREGSNMPTSGLIDQA